MPRLPPGPGGEEEGRKAVIATPKKTARVRKYQAVITRASALIAALKEGHRNLDKITVAMIELERSIDEII